MINKAIYYILSNTTAVTDLVLTRIFALTAPEATKLPLIVFVRDSVVPVYTKSGLEYDESSVTILIFSKVYSNSINILAAVRGALEWNKGIFEGVAIWDARVKGIDEGYDIEADAYYQTISMKFINK